MSEPLTNLPVQLRTIEFRSTGLAFRLEVLVARLDRLSHALKAQGSPDLVSVADMLDLTKGNLARGQVAFDEVSRHLASLDASLAH